MFSNIWIVYLITNNSFLKMNTNRYIKNYLYRAITPHFEKRVSYQSEGMPVRRTKVKVDIVQTNSESYCQKLAPFNPDQLEIDLQSGVKLKKVSSSVLSPDTYQAEIHFNDKKDDDKKVDDTKNE